MARDSMYNSTVNSDPPTHLPSLDTLRGLACLAVVLLHTFPSTYRSRSNAIIPPRLSANYVALVWQHVGYQGVSLFLVLSGFCLYYPMVRRSSGNGKLSLDVKRFALRRARRILPPYYAALVIFVAWDAFVAVRPSHMPMVKIPMAMFQHITGEWVNLVTHLFMLHNLFPATVVSFDGPFWSLALESQLYVIFPALVFFFSRYGAQRTALLSGVLSMLWQIGCRAHFGNHFTEFPIIGSVWYALPARFFEFVCGMWAAEVVTWHYRDNKTNHRAGLIALALVPLALLCSIPAEEICIPGRFIVWGAMFACIVVVVTTTSSTVFWNSAIMRWFTSIGVFSYSLYLVHFPIIGFVNSKLEAHHFGFVILTGLRIGIMAACIGIAYCFHLAFERPFMNTKPRPSRHHTVAELAPGTE